MPEVLIRCPVTGKDISTGISLKAEVFLKVDLHQSIKCSHCGMQHSWSKDDAFLKVPPEREL
jgi:hypothetical protein